MKFDFVIGNPPYQDESNGDGRNYAPPVYNLFLEEAYKVANIVEMIHPARFLFNAGSTPKAWNEKMLQDPHLKVLYYEADSDNVFKGLLTPIKGGIAITYRNEDKKYGEINVFSKYLELNTIINKVVDSKNFASLSQIVFSRTVYRLTKKMHVDNPKAINKLSSGHDYDMSSNIFELLPDIFYDKEPTDGYSYICILGRENNQRTQKFIREEYVNEVDNLKSFKVFIAQANGSGIFGEILSSPILGYPAMGATESFISIGNFANEIEARVLISYIKTKFLRTMLGILKVTQNGNKPVWKYVPLQDFTANSDIDWTKSIAEIDQQLYKKYKLNKQEIEFIETHVKEMS